MVLLRSLTHQEVYHTFKCRCLPGVIDLNNTILHVFPGRTEASIEGDKVDPVGKVFSLSRAGYG